MPSGEAWSRAAAAFSLSDEVAINSTRLGENRVPGSKATRGRDIASSMPNLRVRFQVEVGWDRIDSGVGRTSWL